MVPTTLLRLITRRLILVPADAGLLRLDLSNREALAAKLGADIPSLWPPQTFAPETLASAEKQLAKDPAATGWSLWYVVLRSADTVVGLGGFAGRPDAQGKVDLTYAVLPDFQGHGYGTECAAALAGWAGAHPDVTRVTARAHDGEAARRSLAKAGFVADGEWGGLPRLTFFPEAVKVAVGR